MDNGGDYYDDGDDARAFDNSMMEFELESSCVLLGYEVIEKADQGGMKYVLLHVGGTINTDKLKVTKEPDGWVEP